MDNNNVIGGVMGRFCLQTLTSVEYKFASIHKWHGIVWNQHNKQNSEKLCYGLDISILQVIKYII